MIVSTQCCCLIVVRFSCVFTPLTDSNVIEHNANMLTARDLKAFNFIRNRLVHGHTVTVRELCAEINVASTSTAMLTIEKLIAHGYCARNDEGRLQITYAEENDNGSAATVKVPLVGEVACGTPLFAEENIQQWFDVSTRICPTSYKHFFLRAKGDSMNCAQKPIKDGWLVLVRCQNTAPEGEMVVGLINDEATVKVIHYADDCVILHPKSSNPSHRPIIVTGDFQIQGIAVKAFPPASLLQSDGGEAVS